jgi:hypothetical protein
MFISYVVFQWVYLKQTVTLRDFNSLNSPLVT